MNIEYIKWMVGYAEGFESKNNNVVIPSMAVFSIVEHSEYFDNIIYPLLLQRAIEGINRGDGYLIYQEFSEIRIEHNDNNGFEKYYSFREYGTDNAKEQALKYIYEQEIK